MRILIVDDDKDLCELFSRRFAHQGAIPVTAHNGEEALQTLENHPCDVALLDLSMPGMNGIELLRRLKESHPGIEAVMLTAQGTIESAIEAMRLGAYDYLTKPVRFEELELRTSKAFEKAQLTHRQHQWSQHVEYESARHQLIGSSSALQKVIRLIHKVAPTEATVLIRGESGTGKELVARALHYNSPRCKSPLVTVNCATLQESLLESELFGHEKGSFTGATQAKSGLFEVAKGGTLFVDEIGEMASGSPSENVTSA